MDKVILILVDGMRPDGFLGCGNKYAEALMAESLYSLDCRTVMPSVTLPCHMSLFLSVEPQRHGIITNTYVPQVRPVESLFQCIHNSGGRSAMFYGWEQLRDVAAPGTLSFAEFIRIPEMESTDTYLTDRALARIEASKPDFAFLYLGETDEEGHSHGWMGEKYLNTVSLALDNIKRVIDAFGEEYTVIVTADHGGHGRTHGDSADSDMLIPLFLRGKGFKPGKFQGGSILDIAPTIARIMNLNPPSDWEGVSMKSER